MVFFSLSLLSHDLILKNDVHSVNVKCAVYVYWGAMIQITHGFYHGMVTVSVRFGMWYVQGGKDYTVK